jgi:hypothetical protein
LGLVAPLKRSASVKVLSIASMVSGMNGCLGILFIDYLIRILNQSGEIKVDGSPDGGKIK